MPAGLMWSMIRHEQATASPRHRPHVEGRRLLPWAHRYLTESTQRVDPTLDTDGRTLHTVFIHTHYTARPHQQCSTSFCPWVTFYRFLTAPMSGGSSSDWWDGWEWRGEWTDSSSPGPHTNHADHRRAGHKRCAQASRPTQADGGHDEEAIHIKR